MSRSKDAVSYAECGQTPSRRGDTSLDARVEHSEKNVANNNAQDNLSDSDDFYLPMVFPQPRGGEHDDPGVQTVPNLEKQGIRTRSGVGETAPRNPLPRTRFGLNVGGPGAQRSKSLGKI
jgi:hypothetical protein